MDALEKTWQTDTTQHEHYVLAGDIGGTHTNLALFGVSDSRLTMLYKCVYRTQEISDFSEPFSATIHEIEEHDPLLRPTLSCISVAGPAHGNFCKLTNASWAVDGEAVTQMFGIRTRVINDFHALSFAMPLLDTADERQITRVPHSDGSFPEANGDVMAVIGAGTGLGTGYLVRRGQDYLAYPSEGGHADFAAFDEETIALKQFVMRKYRKSPGTEPFLTGRGIVNIYEFLKDRGMEIHGQLEEIEQLPDQDKPARISELSTRFEECHRVMQLFVSIYAKYAARAALTFLPSGGLYLAGGIVAKNVTHFLEENRFIAEFETSYLENIHGVLMRIPVFIVRDYATSLYGAANAARALME